MFCELSTPNQYLKRVSITTSRQRAGSKRRRKEVWGNAGVVKMRCLKPDWFRVCDANSPSAQRGQVLSDYLRIISFVL